MIITSCLQRSKLANQKYLVRVLLLSAGADLKATSPILRIIIFNLFHHIY